MKEEIFKTKAHYNNWLNQLSEAEKELIFVMMKEYAQLMCEKQIEICKDTYEGNYEITANKISNSPYPKDVL